MRHEGRWQQRVSKTGPLRGFLLGNLYAGIVLCIVAGLDDHPLLAIFGFVLFVLSVLTLQQGRPRRGVNRVPQSEQTLLCRMNGHDWPRNAVDATCARCGCQKRTNRDGSRTYTYPPGYVTGKE